MTNREQKMYQFLNSVSESNAPIVFKGALITKLVLAESGFTEFERNTQDIDANWVDEPPTMDYLVDTINRILNESKLNFYAIQNRTYGEHRSAGITVLDKDANENVFTMDIEIKPFYDCRYYYYGDVKIRGVIPSEILADKLFVLSHDLIFKRTKDMLDIYALAQCVMINSADIVDVLFKSGRVLGNFKAFFNRQNELEHAYNKLKHICGKPTYEDVYGFVNNFISIFLSQSLKKSMIWDSSMTKWIESDEDLSCNEKNKEEYER